MRRFFIAVDAATDPPSLSAVVEGMHYACQEAESEGCAVDEDPAVILLGQLVAFRTHADVNTVRGFRHLIDLCQARIEDRSLQ